MRPDAIAVAVLSQDLLQERPRTATASPAVTVSLRLVAAALAYYLAGRLGLLIPYVGSYVCLVWLPTGIATAAILRWGPAMTVAAAVAAFAVNYQVGGPAWMSAGIAMGNALGPWAAATLLRHWKFDSSLTRGRDLGVLLAAVVAGMLVTSSNGVFWLWTGALLPLQKLPTAWATWWVGDTVGGLLAGVPLLAASRQSLRETFSREHGLLNGVLLAGSLLCAGAAFSQSAALPAALLFPVLTIPLFITTLLALRAGVLAASLAVLGLSCTAAWGTARGLGPFVTANMQAGLLALWAYITAQACASVLICGLTAELTASRRKLSAVFQHAPVGMLQVSLDGRVEGLNPAAARMLGLGRSAASPLRLADLPFGNGQPLVELIRMSDGIAGAACQYFKLRGLDGLDLDVEAQLALCSDARGIEQAQIMLRDVTERRRAEISLAASEERLRAITDNAPALIAELDVEFRFQFANDTYRTWLGIDPAQLLGRTIAQTLGDAVFAEVKPYYDLSLLGEPVSYEREVETPAGARRIQVTIVPKRSASGRISSFLSLGSDVTERVQAEQALKESEQRLRSITDRLPIRVSFIDREERYRFLNLAYETAFGRARREMYGKTVRELVGEGPYTQIGPHIKRALSGETVTFDSELTTRDGYTCYTATYLPQFAADGKRVLGFVAMIADKTAEKLEEHRLIRLSQRDSLTGVLNRAGFDERYQQAYERSRISGNTMAVLLLDLDGFKQVNDTLGHLAGDQLLLGFATRIARSVRTEDIVARLGGDEFAVILQELSEVRDAEVIAEKLIDATRPVFLLESEPVAITTSIGCVTYAGNPAVAPRDLLKRADDLLYAAKAQGRNRCMCAAAGEAIAP